MKLLEWNINQRGGKGQCVPNWVIDEIDEMIDVVILTEFNLRADNIEQVYKKLSDKGFNYRVSNNGAAWGNDVLIAIRNNMRIIDSSFIDAYPDGESNINIPENLRVDIDVRGNTISIFGIRIKELRCDYIARKNQMQTFKKWLDKCNYPIIVAGDFNNNRENTTEKRWNLSILDDIVSTLPHKLVRKTPIENCSWGLSFYCDKEKFDGYIKNDHLLISQNIWVTNNYYDWGFVNKHPKIYVMNNEINQYGQKSVEIPVGYPDHAKLISDVFYCIE